MTCLLLPTVASAHKVKLFATVEGNVINGYVYFPGGGRAQGVTVKIATTDDTQLGETRTDANGQFSYSITQRVDHILSVDTGDGHYAKYTVSASDLSDTLPVPAPTSANSPSTVVSALPTSTETTIALTGLIENSVSKQIRPLREQLETYEEKVRFHDILGGIGYIFGLAGLWILIKRKKN